LATHKSVIHMYQGGCDQLTEHLSDLYTSFQLGTHRPDSPSQRICDFVGLGLQRIIVVPASSRHHQLTLLEPIMWATNLLSSRGVSEGSGSSGLACKILMRVSFLISCAEKSRAFRYSCRMLYNWSKSIRQYQRRLHSYLTHSSVSCPKASARAKKPSRSAGVS
jgi:hypothetical protein